VWVVVSAVAEIISDEVVTGIDQAEMVPREMVKLELRKLKDVEIEENLKNKRIFRKMVADKS